MRIGEFAWGEMEPREGEFHFEWLKELVDKLYENGIYTVLCTPSATPPRWLLNKYPETRMTMHDLIRADVSSRCHTCKTSPVMREKNRIIVTKMAETFAGHKGVIGSAESARARFAVILKTNSARRKSSIRCGVWRAGRSVTTRLMRSSRLIPSNGGIRH